MKRREEHRANNGIFNRSESKLDWNFSVVGDVLELGMRRVLPEPQGKIHSGEAEAGGHDRVNFRIWLQQPLRHEVVFRLASDVDEPCVPSLAVIRRLSMVRLLDRVGQMVALSVVWYLVLATMRDTIRNASYTDRVSVHSALLIVGESRVAELSSRCMYQREYLQLRSVSPRWTFMIIMTWDSRWWRLHDPCTITLMKQIYDI